MIEEKNKAQSNVKNLLDSFRNKDTRFMKYLEILLFKEDANPLCYQDKKEYSLAIELTTICNLNCLWCHRRDSPSKNLNKSMNFRKLEKLLPQLKDFKKIHFTGVLGEPLMHPMIVEIIKLCKEYVDEVVITTNATLLTKDMTNKLATAGLDFIEVSIDAFTPGKNKQYRGNPAELEKIHENIKYFSEHSRIPIQINSVVSSENLKDIYLAIDFVKDIPTIKIFHTIKLFMSKYMKEHNIQIVSELEHKKLLEHLKKEAEKINLKIQFSPDTNQLKFDPIIEMKKRANICFIPFDGPIIDVEGNLLPCCKIYDIKLGNVFEEGFDAIWNGEKAKRFRKNMLEGEFPDLCVLQCNLKKCLKNK